VNPLKIKIPSKNIREKPTNTPSTHPLQHKLAAYRYYINRMLTLPITNTERRKEWSIIQNIAHNNGFPPNLILKLRYQLENATKTHENQSITSPRAWVTFTFNNPAVHKIKKTSSKTQALTLHIDHQIQSNASFNQNLPIIYSHKAEFTNYNAYPLIRCM
jgi:hypothetical protein